MLIAMNLILLWLVAFKFRGKHSLLYAIQKLMKLKYLHGRFRKYKAMFKLTLEPIFLRQLQ